MAIKRKAGRVITGIINLLFPVRDIAHIITTAPRPLLLTLRRTREVFAQQEKEKADLSWAEAVAASGMTEQQLASRYRVRQYLWRMVMLLSLLASLLLLTLVIRSWPTLSGYEALRALSFALVLHMLMALAFVKSMEATFRRWQLLSHRVSLEEKGTFVDFAAENRWIRQTLGW